MSLLYSPNLKYPDGEMRKNQMETMDSSYKIHLQQQQTQTQTQTHHLNTGLTRYSSAPSSVIESLMVNGAATNGAAAVEDYQFIRSSSPEMESLFAKYMGNGSGGKKGLKQEDGVEIEVVGRQHNGSYGGYGSDSIQKTFPGQYMERNENSTAMNSSFGCGMNSMDLENSRKYKVGSSANGSSLVRQSSSPAGFLSNLGVENGFAVMKDSGNLRGPNGNNDEVGLSTNRLSGHINFSSSGCRPSIVADVANENFGTTNLENRNMVNVNGNNDRSSHYIPTSWNETHGNMFSSLNTLENQNGDSRNRTTTGLTHQLSMPNTSNEMAIIDKYLQFQGTVPCKVRAKRGFATHPRSIAERVRRTRISERMRKLQELFPNMDKQANTADMLDLAVKHIKDLQKQVKTLTDKKAKCTCKEKQPCPTPLA